MNLLMILAFGRLIFFSALAGEPVPFRTYSPPSGVECKSYEYKVGCNICSAVKCTDGVTQWDLPNQFCTQAYCKPGYDVKLNPAPHDPSFWRSTQNRQNNNN